jgi:alkylated DNA nucleotide flippase Atl1
MATVAQFFGDEKWFEPREDSEASQIFKAMSDIPVGGVLTYDDLDRILGRDFKSNRGPWNNALRRWHRDMPNGGTWRCVQRVGYQLVADWDKVQETGKSHESRMRSQARKSKARYKSADQAQMSDAEKRVQSEMLTRIGKLEAAMRSTKKEIAVLKKTKADTTDVDDLRQQVKVLSEKLDKI